MEVISSDFDRTIKKVTSDEKIAADAFDKFAKETKLGETKSDLVEQQQALKDATEIVQSGEDKLSELQAQCVEGEETWEERAAARKKEIEALKQAQTILDEWQG